MKKVLAGMTSSSRTMGRAAYCEHLVCTVFAHLQTNRYDLLQKW